MWYVFSIQNICILGLLLRNVIIFHSTINNLYGIILDLNVAYVIYHEI
jgi:hypothetical protein